jgi:signal transduction histidine kinase
MLFSPSVQRLNDLVDWFLPPSLEGDRETRQQARMFLFSHLFGPFIGNTVPLALYLLDPTPGWDVAVLAFSITLFWALPFVLRSLAHYNLLVLISVQNLVFCVLLSCFVLGGVSSPTLPWVLIIPLLAFFYLGPNLRMGFIVLGLFLLNLGLFAILSVVADPPVNDLSPQALQFLGIVSTVGTCLYVVMMALYYGKILAAGSELESEVRLHLATATRLRQSTAAAERANLAKSEFLAKMSHELRTPLNAIIGYAEMLLEDASAEGDQQSSADLEKIRAAGLHLLKLINQVLDLSKIEAGRMDLVNEPVQVRGLILSAIDAIRAQAAKNRNQIAVHLDERLGIACLDGHKLQRAVAQILENAVKFTEGGTVTVSAWRRTRAGGEELAIEVKDTGIGIAPEFLPGLFEKFSGVHDASATKYGGTGLGLVLSEKLCRLMGGAIAVTSEVGTGSCFTIRLPVRDAGTGEAEAPAAPVLAAAAA